jgi:light-harvesting complex 1 beta chain
MAEVSRTGLTEGEAREIHKLVLTGAAAAMAAAFFAHFMVWLWRPLVYGQQIVPPDWRHF